MNMERIKICPDCATEYFPNIDRCADCGTVLLLPEEIRLAHEEKERCAEKALENPVVVREGDLAWMDELFNVLIEAGIPCAVIDEAGCNKGCCGGTYRLIVSSQDAEKADEQIEDYFEQIHPESQVSREMVQQGKCPACGSPVNSGATECPDCGLPLLLIE